MNGLYLPPIPLGASFAHVALAAGAATVLIPVATNTNGMIVRSLAWLSAGAAAAATIYADSAAPVGISDVAKRMIAAMGSGSLSWAQFPIDLPAGIGLFGWAAGAGHVVCVAFDVK
jgi:hypothetical protein